MILVELEASIPRASMLKPGSDVTALVDPSPLPLKSVPESGVYIGTLITLSCNEEVEPLPTRPHSSAFSSSLLETFAFPEVPGDCAVSALVLTLLPALPTMGALVVLQRLEPLDKKLPNVMDPWVLMKGVAKCCWLG